MTGSFRTSFHNLTSEFAIECFRQVTKGRRWMPRHTEAMKDVVSCDKPRRGANNLRTADFRMGQPGRGHARSLPAEYIGGLKPTQRIETS